MGDMKMSINKELSKLKETDIWSLLMFVLYKVKDTEEYSSLSELSYVLDKRNMLKLCEYFGGSTLYIPTIDELERLIYGMLLYQYVDIEHLDYDEALGKIYSDDIPKMEIKTAYNKIRTTLSEYKISPRGD
jgi:hypothetical protein